MQRVLCEYGIVVGNLAGEKNPPGPIKEVLMIAFPSRIYASESESLAEDNKGDDTITRWLLLRTSIDLTPFAYAKRVKRFSSMSSCPMDITTLLFENFQLSRRHFRHPLQMQFMQVAHMCR